MAETDLRKWILLVFNYVFERIDPVYVHGVIRQSHAHDACLNVLVVPQVGTQVYRDPLKPLGIAHTGRELGVNTSAKVLVYQVVV